MNHQCQRNRIWREKAGWEFRRPFFMVSLWVVSGILLASGTAHAVDPNPPSIHSNRGAWPICRQWTQAEVEHFAQWIQHIYKMKTEGSHEQRIARLERILTDPEMNLLLVPEFAGERCNEPLGPDTLRAMHHVVDCAKLTVALSTYYASRRGLPWTASYVRAGDGGDVRTAEYTAPVGVASSLDYSSASQFALDAITGTCTGNFRVEVDGKNAELSDTVPVAITREHLLPGCLYYLDGHVLILADITPYGEPRFLDATVAPSRDIYAFNGLNAVSGSVAAKPEAGKNAYKGCYRGFRAYRWPVAETDAKGCVTRVRRRTNEEMRPFGYSLEQYDKLSEMAAQQKIVENGVFFGSFHQFLLYRLRTAQQFHPIADIRAFAAQWIASLQAREQSIQQTWHDVVSGKGPVPFPEDRVYENVFTARGRWGEYSSALEDTECRGRYFDLLERLENAITIFELRPEDVDLDGLNLNAIWTSADLADALLEAKKRIFAETSFEYANSEGNSVRLSLLDVEKRLYDLSFDPNHAPELRWGEPILNADTQNAKGKATPLPAGKEVPVAEAYAREAYYRSLIHWEPDPSYLREMFTEGFSRRETLEPHLSARWCDRSSPPLVPHGGKAAWLGKGILRQ